MNPPDVRACTPDELAEFIQQSVAAEPDRAWDGD
jgi:hypothetical protein